ncbi:MAG: hypothetical protein JW946_00760 [Candidatus Omnitrophica bacterium]|nr:hypothetical protein [Candidatus Omnitrophota bacterium]
MGLAQGVVSEVEPQNNMPPIPEKEDSKEIKLFGEKSIREQAYRQKILQLEVEVMKLEAVLKGEAKDAVALDTPKTPNDENFKKYEKILEAKAKTIGDELNAQALSLVKQERMHNRLAAAKKTLGILSVFVAIAVVLSGICLFAILKLSEQVYKKNMGIAAPYARSGYIKSLLQENGFYKNQYTITALNYDNHGYDAVVELHFKPHDKWSVKMIASDILENFKRITTGRSLRLDFVYDGDNYASVDFSPINNETRYNFFNR